MAASTSRLRAHDYARLARRWKALARKAGLNFGSFARSGGHELLFAATPGGANRPALYLSAGIHGDEAAATEGLVEWAETSVAFLRRTNVFLLPCLNPWGLVQNSREDHRGLDLNRCFHRNALTPIRQYRQLVRHRRFHLSMCLHEDYDGQGVYLYEIPSAKPYLGERILAAASKKIPREPRTRVEGRACRHGLVRRAIRPEQMPHLPEALYLHFGFSQRTLTLETPSEFDLQLRLESQIAALEEIARITAETPTQYRA